MQKLTRAGVGLATTGIALLGLGMGMGNLELLALAAFPLLLLAYALASRPQGGATGTRALSTRAPRRGDVVDVDVRARHAPDADLMEVHAPIPDGFSLEEGSNVALFTAPGHAGARFRMRAHARGSHTMAPLRVETIDPRGILAPAIEDVTGSETVSVTPRAFHAEKLRRRIRGRAILLPDREEARMGVGSTDFRELRDYVWGDAPKSINWKATARRLSTRGGADRGGQTPLVNEYEKEGRTTVLVLLDGGAHMRVGTSLETGLDHAVEASLAAARLFLARGARVGAATFGARSAAHAPPDTGSGQIPRVERALSPGEPDDELTASRVLSSFERHLAGARPVLLIVTRVTPKRAPELAELVKRVRVLVRERRRGLPIYVVDVRALDLAPTPAPGWELARRIVALEDDAASRKLAAAGARIVPWSPGREDFRAALLRRSIA